MRRYLFITSVICIFLATFSCHTTKPIIAVHKTLDSLLVQITTRNISEDFSGKDEVVILGYAGRDSLLGKPIFAQKFHFGKNSGSQRFYCAPYESIEHKPLLIFLIEEDDDTTIDELDTIVRNHHSEIRKYFSKHDYTSLELYLGDDDILGITSIAPVTCESKTIINVTGVYKIDRYDYLIEIGCK